MKASDKWEEAALKKAYELDLPGSGSAKTMTQLNLKSLAMA